MKNGNPYGTHRVLEPQGVLPQPARRLDNTMTIYDNEVLVDVSTLNIDSASFTQLENAAGGDEKKITESILAIVNQRGKMQNPVTGSGGMLIGTVAALGPNRKKQDLSVGDKIASLVSLSLTPLKIHRILAVHPETDQVDVEAQAILFDSGIYAKLPQDMDEKLALAVLDVAGAPAQTARMVKSGDTVLVIGGGGKSGLLCLHEAKKRAGITGKVIGLSRSDAAIGRIQQTGLADSIIQANATQPLDVLDAVRDATGGELCDVVINTVNVPDTEMASILPCKDGGMVYFFSMATSFTKAALGAEGVGKDITMIVGNGYAKNHAEITLEVLRENPVLHDMFTQMYARGVPA
ncbi:MAG: zinc-binding dehydrogenase [Spirochaetales bacterium]|nr:zinc-binding dehydrogenase [Spirochaetales bacterium]